MKQIRQIIHDLRSGLSFTLLTWAMNMAPDDERASMAVAVYDHIARVCEADIREGRL